MASFKGVSKRSHSQGGLSTVNTVVTNKFILSGTGHGQFSISNTIGPTGFTGPTGPDGITGPLGPNYPTGATGATGPTGPTGYDQPTGPTGPPGDTGMVGSARCTIDGSGTMFSYTTDVVSDSGRINMASSPLGEYAFIPGQPILITAVSGRQATAVITDTDAPPPATSLTPYIDFSYVSITVPPALAVPELVDVKLEGDQGVRGYTGPTGYAGITGPPGFTGPTGHTGATGPDGSLHIPLVQHADGVVMMYYGDVWEHSSGAYSWRVPAVADTSARRWYICDGGTIVTTDGATTRTLPDISSNVIPVGATGSGPVGTDQSGPTDADRSGNMSAADGIPVYMHEHAVTAPSYPAMIGVHRENDDVNASWPGVSSPSSSYSMITMGATQPVDGNGTSFPATIGSVPSANTTQAPAWPVNSMNNDSTQADFGLWTPGFNSYNVPINHQWGAMAGGAGWNDIYTHGNAYYGLGYPHCFYGPHWRGGGNDNARGTVVPTAGFVNPSRNTPVENPPGGQNVPPPVSHTHKLTFSTDNWLLEFPVLDQNTLWQMQAADDLFQASTDTTDQVTLHYNQENSNQPLEWGRTDGATGTALSTKMKHTPIYFITYYEGFQWW